MTTTICKDLGYVPAEHQLVNHDGLCRNPHGHNYQITVEVSGNVQDLPDHPRQGMVVDFSEISQAWKQIKPIWDHMNLNVVLSERDINAASSDDEAAAITARLQRGYPDLLGPTTAENLAEWLMRAFWLEGVPASAVTVWETPTSWARYER